MRLNSSFPHPVLGINKGIIPDLESDNLVYVKNENKNSYIYDFTLKFGDKYILTYIKEGLAEYVCEVDCRKTLLKKKYVSNKPTFHIELARLDVDEHIDFSFFVQTKCAILNYSNPSFNPDYRDIESGKMPVFSLDKGDILVMFSDYSDNVKIALNEKISLSSFLQIRRGDSELEHMNVDLSEDVIYVELPEKQYDDFLNYNNNDARGVLYSSIILTALTEAVLHISDYSDKTWSDSIKARVDKEKIFAGLDEDNPKDAAQISFKLLTGSYGDPFDLLFKSLNNINNM